MFRLQMLLYLLLFTCAFLANINAKSYVIESMSTTAIITPDSCSVRMSDTIVATFEGSYTRLARAIVTQTASNIRLRSITSPDVTITSTFSSSDSFGSYLNAKFDATNRTVTLNFQYDLLDGVNHISPMNTLYLDFSFNAPILKTNLVVDLSEYQLQSVESISVTYNDFDPVVNVTPSSVVYRLSDTIPALNHWSTSVNFPKGSADCTRIVKHHQKKKKRTALIVCLCVILPVSFVAVLTVVIFAQFCKVGDKFKHSGGSHGGPVSSSGRTGGGFFPAFYDSGVHQNSGGNDTSGAYYDSGGGGGDYGGGGGDSGGGGCDGGGGGSGFAD